MGPRDPSGGARLAEFLAALHRIALMHGKLGEVHVDGGQSLAVVEDDAVPFEEQITREDDDTGVGGQNRSTRSGAEIDAVVLAEELAIEHSAHAKRFRNDRINALFVVEPFAVKFGEPAAGSHSKDGGGAVDGMGGTSYDFKVNGPRGGNDDSAKNGEDETLCYRRANCFGACEGPGSHLVL